MRQPGTFKHEFVQFIPEELQERTVYVSIRFATVSHLCACGCKTKVVTPLKPTDWKLTFDGKTVSLHPSIGNWNLPCRSHYWIRNNRVQWDEDWSQRRIDATRNYDRRSREKYFRGEATTDETATPLGWANPTIQGSPLPSKRSLWRSLWPW
jgi:hypothetical protein